MKERTVEICWQSSLRTVWHDVICDTKRLNVRLIADTDSSQSA